MDACLSTLFRCLSLLVLSTLLLVGCNRMDLAYRNLDVLVPWSLSDYLSMNRQQKGWLDERLKAHLAWHCRTQLPGYLTWLGDIRQMVAHNEVTDAQLRLRTEQAKQAIAEVADQIMPSATQLLRGMDDEQVSDMREAFAEDIREREAKYVKTPLARQIEQRQQRMEKRLTPWLGELTPVQKQRVQAWSQALGDHNREWIANRAHWQQQLLLAMNQRNDASFEPRLATLLQRKESLWTPAYRAAFQNTERQARSLLVDLVQQSTPQQRRFLQDRLGKVRTDFSELKCLRG